MTGTLVEAYTNALRAMADNVPRGLVRRALLEAEEIDPHLDVSEARLREHLATSGPNDLLRRALHLNLAKWDYTPVVGNPWTGDTRPNTERRRALVIEALRLEEETAREFAKHFPIFCGDGTTVIAGPWDPWYTEEIRRERSFYWRDYVEYLGSRRGWSAEAIADLDIATTHIVERLIEPSREKAGQTKGLVVGYVQSGKTANFTGVIAKAIDAGYRLIIVMTGTTNLLRQQTQRRLDMELVGRENVLRGADENDESARERVDYLDDEDWAKGKFVSHGARPSEIGKPDIYRMTTRERDYRKLQQGLPALEFERSDRTKPLWHPENLFTSDARLSIVKKNSSVLNNLVKDLKHNADKLENIPALIIDDESDQASINTVDPKKWVEEKKKRTAINKHISSLLSMLPRAQYVGYTATPFANVFVDPTDDEDIFPKDYLIALQRPVGYMGAEDFHDLDSTVPDTDKTYANSNERAHLRLVGKDDEEAELRAALDSFVLAGAIKLFRLNRDPEEFERPFKHHTMLVHETMRKDAQRTRADSIRDLWRTGGYLSGGAICRLRHLFERDFNPVTIALDLGYPSPASFDELIPHLGVAARNIAPHGNPVLVVNSDPDLTQEEVDFDKRSVWRVLVGGNKLARGFTVEGLTVTYYSRDVGHAEALMQMGRWFGFRSGYRDLVRLFTTSAVRDAFEAACRDEEDFRKELRQYAVMVDGRPAVTPEQIQPLVSRRGLRPTAANKMYNARLVQRRTLTKEPSSGYPSIKDQPALDHNLDACVPLLEAVSRDLRTLTSTKGNFDAFSGTVSHEKMVSVLEKLRWATPDTFAPDFAWIASLPNDIVKEWEIVLPQQKTRKRVNLRGIGDFTIHGRKVEREVRIRGNSESLHRAAIEEMSRGCTHTGYTLLYPIMDKEKVHEPISDNGRPSGIAMAFMLQLPRVAIPDDRRPLIYQVAVREKPLYAIIDER